MPEQPVDDNKTPTPDNAETNEGRRPILRKFARFVAVTPPVIALLLAAKTKQALAATSLL
jgi:hypothetical protein